MKTMKRIILLKYFRLPVLIFLFLSFFGSWTFADLIGWYTEQDEANHTFDYNRYCPLQATTIITDYRIDSVSVYIEDSDIANYLKVGIYNDIGAFGPDTLQAGSDTIDVAANPTIKVWTVPDISLNDTLLEGQQYWTGVIGNGSDHLNVVDTGAAWRDSSYQYQVTTWPTLPTIANPISSAGTRLMNIKIWVTDVSVAAKFPGRRRRMLLGMSEPEERSNCVLLYSGDPKLLTDYERQFIKNENILK